MIERSSIPGVLRVVDPAVEIRKSLGAGGRSVNVMQMLEFTLTVILLKCLDEDETIDIPETLTFPRLKKLAPDMLPGETMFSFLEAYAKALGIEKERYSFVNNRSLEYALKHAEAVERIFVILAQEKAGYKSRVRESYLRLALSVIYELSDERRAAERWEELFPSQGSLYRLLSLLVEESAQEKMSCALSRDGVFALFSLAKEMPGTMVLPDFGTSHEEAIGCLLMMIAGKKCLSWQKIKDPCLFTEASTLKQSFDLCYAFAPDRWSIPDFEPDVSPELLSANFAFYDEELVSDQLLYVRQAIQMIREGGTAYVFLPVNLLTRIGKPEALRKKILEENLLDCVIEFPPKLINQKNYFPALLILKKGRREETVKMVKLTGEEAQKYIRPADNRFGFASLFKPAELSKLIREGKETNGVLCLVTKDEIAGHSFCFNPGAYFMGRKGQEGMDLVELFGIQDKLEEKMAGIDEDYKDALKDFEKWRNHRNENPL